MLALGNGARAAVAENFRMLGSDSIMISEKMGMKNGEFAPINKILSFGDGLNLISAVPQVTRVDMSVSGSGKVRHARSVVDLTFIGSTESFLESMAADGSIQPVNWPNGKKMSGKDFTGQGRFFTSPETLDSSDVVVPGVPDCARPVWWRRSLGQTVWVNHRSFTVIGVLAEVEYVDPQQRYQSSKCQLRVNPADQYGDPEIVLRPSRQYR